MYKNVFLFLIIFLSGCDVISSEREIIRFSLEQGFKSGCDDNVSCIEKIESNISQCLTDTDLDDLIKTSGSEYDENVKELASKVYSCLNSSER